MTTRKILAGAAALLALGYSLPASAQSVTDGSLIVAFERTFGFGSGKVEQDFDGGGEAETSGTAFTLGSPLVTPVEGLFIPRLGIDYVVSDPVTIGGAVGFGTANTDDDNDDDVNQTAFLLAPRAGGYFGISDSLGIWPRGGITFLSYSRTDDDGAVETEYSFTAWQLNLEGWLVFEVIPGGAFMVGGYLDFPIGGSGEADVNNNSTDFDVSVQTFGISTGIALVL